MDLRNRGLSAREIAKTIGYSITPVPRIIMENSDSTGKRESRRTRQVLSYILYVSDTMKITFRKNGILNIFLQ